MNPPPPPPRFPPGPPRPGLPPGVFPRSAFASPGVRPGFPPGPPGMAPRGMQRPGFPPGLPPGGTPRPGFPPRVPGPPPPGLFPPGTPQRPGLRTPRPGFPPGPPGLSPGFSPRPGVFPPRFQPGMPPRTPMGMTPPRFPGGFPPAGAYQVLPQGSPSPLPGAGGMAPPTPPPLPGAPLEAPAPSPPPARSASLSGVDEQEEARRNLLLKESKEKLQSLLDKKLQYWDKLTVAKEDQDKLEAIRNIMSLNKDEIELAGKVGPKDKLVDVMDTKLKLATETLDHMNAEIQKGTKEKLKQLEKWEAGAITNLKNLNRMESELAMRLSKRRSKNQDRSSIDQEDDVSRFGERDREGDLDKYRDRDSDRERDRSIGKERRKKSDTVDREEEEKKPKGEGEKELQEKTKRGTSEKEAEEAKDDAKHRVQRFSLVELDARADTQMCDENLLKLHELEFRIANDMLKGKYKGKKGRDLTSKEMKEKLRRLCDLEVQIADELFGQDPDASASLELDAIITKPSAKQVTTGKEYNREQRRRSSRDSDEREGRDRDYGDRRDYLDRRDFYERRDFSPVDRMDYPDIMEFPDYPERMVYADQYGGARIDYPGRMNYPPQADYRRGNMQIPPGMLQMQAMPQIPQMAPVPQNGQMSHMAGMPQIVQMPQMVQMPQVSQHAPNAQSAYMQPIDMEEPGNELVRHHENIEVSGDSTVQVIKHTAHSELIRSPSSDPRSLDVPPKRYISEDSLDTSRKPIVATFEQVADDQTTLVKLKTAIDIEIIPQGGKPASLDKGDTRGSVRGGIDDVESEVHIRNRKSREILNVAVTSSSLPMGPSSGAPVEPTPRPAARTSPFYWTSSRRTPLAEDEDYDAYGEEDSVSMNRRGQDLADRRVAMDDEIPPGPSFWQWICQSIYSPRRGRTMAERPERSLERGRSRSRDQERDDRVREKEEELRQLIDSVIKVSQDVIMARRAIELGGVGEERCLGNMLEAEGKLRDLIDLEVRLANELSNFRNSDMVPNEESRMSVLNAEEKIRQLIDVESRLAEGFVTERKSLSSLPHNTEGAFRAFEVLATQQHPQSPQPRDARRRPASRREPSSRRPRDEDLDDGGSPRRRPSWSRLADRSRGTGDDDDRRRGDRSLSRPRARDVSPTRRGRAVQRGRRDSAELGDDEERPRRSSSRRRRPSDDDDQDDRRETIHRGLPPDDVDDDERLRRRGSKKRADDDDELPARHRASRPIQGEEEDEAPRMLSRKKQVDDVEERTPRRGASKSRKEDDDEVAHDDEEDGDEAMPRRGRPRARRARTGSKGRGAKVTAQKQVIKVTEGVPVKISLSGKVVGKKRHNSGGVFGELSSSLSGSEDGADGTAGMHKFSSGGTLVGKRSITFGTPRGRRLQAKSPSSTGRRSGKCSTVSVITVSASDSDEISPGLQEVPQRNAGRFRQLKSPRSRAESRMWSRSPPPQLIQGQTVTRSCSRHQALRSPPQLRSPALRSLSRSPSNWGGCPGLARMHSASPHRNSSPIRVASPRRQVFEVVDDVAYYAEPVVRDRARLLRREDQRFQMSADEPRPQVKGKWHNPKLRVTYAHRAPSVAGTSHSESTLVDSHSSRTTQRLDRGDEVAHLRVASTGQPLCRASSPEFRQSFSPTPLQNSPPKLRRPSPQLLCQFSSQPRCRSSSSSETWHTQLNTRRRQSPQPNTESSWTSAQWLALSPRRRSSSPPKRRSSPQPLRRSSSSSVEWPPSPAQRRFSPLAQRRSIPQPLCQSSSISADWPPSLPICRTSPRQRHYSPQPLCRTSSTLVNRPRLTPLCQSSSTSMGWPSAQPGCRRSSPPVYESSSTLAQWSPSAGAHRAFNMHRVSSPTSPRFPPQIVYPASPVERRRSVIAMSHSPTGRLSRASSAGLRRPLSPPPPKPPMPPSMPPPRGFSMLPAKREGSGSSISALRLAMSPPPVPPIPPVLLPPTPDMTMAEPESSTTIADVPGIEESLEPDLVLGRIQQEQDQKDQLRHYEQQHQQILLQLQQKLQLQQTEQPRTNLYNPPELQTVSKFQSMLQSQFQVPPLSMSTQQPLAQQQSMLQAQFQSSPLTVLQDTAQSLLQSQFQSSPQTTIPEGPRSLLQISLHSPLQPVSQSLHLDGPSSTLQMQCPSPQQISSPLLSPGNVMNESLSMPQMQAQLPVQFEMQRQGEPPPVLQVQFHSPTQLMPQMNSEMQMQMQLSACEPHLAPEMQLQNSVQPTTQEGRMGVTPMQYSPLMQEMQPQVHFQEQQSLRPQKSRPHTVVTLQRPEQNVRPQMQDRPLQSIRSVQPRNGQPRGHSPPWSYFEDIGQQPTRFQPGMSPRMPLRVPPHTFPRLRVPQQFSPRQMASMAASTQPFDPSCVQQQKEPQGLFKSQDQEPCMQQIPLPVMGHDPTSTTVRPTPLPFRLSRPRSPVPAQQPDTSRAIDFQVQLQQHILEQHQQMQEKLRAARSQHISVKSPTSSVQIQMRHNSAPPVAQEKQQAGIALQGMAPELFARQQMMRQQRQVEEQFRRQGMLEENIQLQQRERMQAGQVLRREGDNSSTDARSHTRRIVVSASSTKTSLGDTDSPTDYGGTEYGGSDYGGTQYGGAGYGSTEYGGTKYGGARSKKNADLGSQGLVPPAEGAKQKLATTIPRKQNYRHTAIETRMRNSQTEMVVYFVVLLATIIGLWTVLDIYGRRVSMHPNGTLYMIPSNGDGKGINGGDARVGVLVNVSGQPGFEICNSAACQVEGSYVSHQLNWNVNPCESMYKFVCSKSAQASPQSSDSASLSDLEVSLLRLLQHNEPPSQAGRLLNRLWNECLDTRARNQHGWGPLKHMLKAAALGDWPYLQYSTQGEPAIWESAALLLRYFGLATLVQLEPSGVSVTGRGPLLALDKPTSLLKPNNDSTWYYDAASLAASVTARKNVVLHSVALEVTNFARLLAGVLRSPSATGGVDLNYRVKKLRSIPRYRALLVAFLQNKSQVNDNTEVLLRAPEYVIRLGYLLDDTPPHTVLNYMGFRMVVHVSPFLPEALNKLTLVRARQLGLGSRTTAQVLCLRVVAQSLPTVFYRVAYEAHRKVLDALLAADLGSALKQAFASRLGLVHWLDGDTRERALQRLHQLQLQLLFPSWITDSIKAAQDANHVPEIIPGEGLRSYARITKHLMQRRLEGAEPWLSASPTEQRCWLDPSRHMLYVPLTALNTSTPAEEPFLLLQLAHLGERVARCLVQFMLEGASQNLGVPRSWWTADARQGFGSVQKCYKLQNDGMLSEVRVAEDSAALVLAHTAFEARMPAIDFRLENAVSMSLDQLFFIRYVLGQCSVDPEAPRRVNLALLNFRGFQRAFTCDPGTPMNPRKSCDFW